MQRVETRGLEKKCNGDCIELKAAKQEIAELVEENRLLRAKLDRANEDLRSSQEAQMSQNLRHCYESIINLHNQKSKHHFATIKSQLSIQSNSTPLLKVQKNGNVKTYSPEMLRLGIKLIAGVLMSARMIPKAMDAILRAAGLDSKTEIEIPTYTYFNNIRPMLQHMNREIIKHHCQNAKYLSLGVDESPRRIKSSNVISVVLTDENGTSCLVKVAEHNERGELQKSTYDAEKAIQILKSELGDEFKPTMKKTLNIITDSCSNAKATREKLVQKLDDMNLIDDQQRVGLPCDIHIFNIAEEDTIKFASPSGRLESLSKRCGFNVAPPKGQPQDNIYLHWQKVVPARNFKYYLGKRFRYRLDNVNLAFVEFGNLKQVVEQTASTSAGAFSINELLEDHSIYVEMAVVGKMIPLLEHCWSKLSVIQPAHELQAKLKELHEAVELVAKNEIAVEDVLETFHQSEAAEEVNNIIENDFFGDEDYASKLHDVFLKVTRKLLNSMDPFMKLNESMTILPTNIDVERFVSKLN